MTPRYIDWTVLGFWLYGLYLAFTTGAPPWQSPEPPADSTHVEWRWDAPIPERVER